MRKAAGSGLPSEAAAKTVGMTRGFLHKHEESLGARVAAVERYIMQVIDRQRMTVTAVHAQLKSIPEFRYYAAKDDFDFADIVARLVAKDERVTSRMQRTPGSTTSWRARTTKRAASPIRRNKRWLFATKRPASTACCIVVAKRSRSDFPTRAVPSCSIRSPPAVQPRCPEKDGVQLVKMTIEAAYSIERKDK
ncbi:MAG TPA: hypothetical protein VM261_28890 [Kofleriaceae bacterium]|nr:hypothetical protein [Kofleriaceae bacterium]